MKSEEKEMQKPRTIMIYGDSGGTKTSQAYHLANYFHRTYNYIGRMIGTNASDNAPFEDSGMLEKKIIDFFDISNRQLALADLRRLSEGYWPRDLKELGKGNKGYFKSDEACKARPEKLGFYLIEGATGVSSLLLNHIRAQDEGVGFKHSFKYEEDGYTIGGLQAGHYGLVQQELYKLMVQGFACLPVKFVVWTALVGKGEDRTKQSVYGPKIAGDALTFEVPAWFGDCIHLDTVVEDGLEKRVAWFTKHYDKDTGIPYLCKVRMLPELYPKLLAKWPKGYVELGFKNGLNLLYEETDRIVAEYQKEQGLKEKEGK